MIHTQIDWSNKYLGKKWTEQENCFYWTSRIIEECTLWSLPLVEELNFHQRTKVLLREQHSNWVVIDKPSKHFDIILMRHVGSKKNLSPCRCLE